MSIDSVTKYCKELETDTKKYLESNCVCYNTILEYEEQLEEYERKKKAHKTARDELWEAVKSWRAKRDAEEKILKELQKDKNAIAVGDCKQRSYDEAKCDKVTENNPDPKDRMTVNVEVGMGFSRPKHDYDECQERTWQEKLKFAKKYIRPLCKYSDYWVRRILTEYYDDPDSPWMKKDVDHLHPFFHKLLPGKKPSYVEFLKEDDSLPKERKASKTESYANKYWKLTQIYVSDDEVGKMFKDFEDKPPMIGNINCCSNVITCEEDSNCNMEDIIQQCVNDQKENTSSEIKQKQKEKAEQTTTNTTEQTATNTTEQDDSEKTGESGNKINPVVIGIMVFIMIIFIFVIYSLYNS
jgi:hypothetical protein